MHQALITLFTGIYHSIIVSRCLSHVYAIHVSVAVVSLQGQELAGFQSESIVRSALSKLISNVTDKRSPYAFMVRLPAL